MSGMNAAYIAIHDHFKANVETTMGIDVVYEQEHHTEGPSTPEEETPLWIYFDIDWGNRDVLEFSGQGADGNILRRSCMLELRVSVPVHKSRGLAHETADAMEALYKAGLELDDVRFHVPQTTKLGENEPWWSLLVRCPFTVEPA